MILTDQRRDVTVLARIRPKFAISQSRSLTVMHPEPQSGNHVLVSERITRVLGCEAVLRPLGQLEPIARAHLVEILLDPAVAVDIRYGALIQEGCVVCVDAFGDKFVKVTRLEPKCGVAMITKATKIVQVKPKSEVVWQSLPAEEDWVDDVVAELGKHTQKPARELVRMIRHASDFLRDAKIKTREMSFRRGALVHGPSGIGKDALIESVLAKGGVQSEIVAPDLFFRSQQGEGEQALVDLLTTKRKSGPFVLVIDNIDVLGTSPRLVATLGACMDRAFTDQNSPLLVIATTTNPQLVSGLLLRPKRFGISVLLGPPIGMEERRDLVRLVLSKHGIQDLDGSLATTVSVRCNGLVPAEVDAIGAELAINADSQSIEDILASCLRSSALKHALIARLGAGQLLDEIPGLEQAKNALHSSVILPLENPERLRKMGLLHGGPRGILLYGPSGNGKSLVAKALSATLDQRGLSNVISAECPALVSKVVGASEANVVRVFEQARAAAPCVLVLDQIDAIAPPRGADSSSEQTMDRLLSSLLTLMDGIQSKTVTPGPPVIVVATTVNRNRLDPAILRPGRLDVHVAIQPPVEDSETVGILEYTLRNTQLSSDVQLDVIASQLSGKSRAEIAAVAQEAALFALREDISADKVCQHHLLQTVKRFAGKELPHIE